MKKLILLLLGIFLLSCSSNVNDVAGYNFDNAWYWFSEYEAGTPVEELKKHAQTFSNPNHTSYFLFYDKSKMNIREIKNESFTKNELFKMIVENKPDTSFYFLPKKVDSKIKTDAMWLIESAIKEK